ncbi:MAG TPA: M1 family aminopeptidase [Ferruginibacter sp.]|nr:M1 family aminopeptidase [Ferruginibacter sp.]
MARIKITVLIVLFAYSNIYGQNTTNIDVQHYRFELILSDHTDTIRGRATVSLKFLENASIFHLDLGNVDSTGKGMMVVSVKEAGTPVSFRHSNGKLRLQLTAAAKAGNNQVFTVEYMGIPSDGLVIGKSIFNKRTFFGDNWPNRAHHWLPCNDIPADKASVEFLITAPKHFSIVSNGIKVEERLLNDSSKRTHWKEDVPLPTKVMVIGAADFAVSEPAYAGNIPVTSWVYAEEKDKGFKDYAPAKDILLYYIDYIGPYPYKKLANVQSKTIFGGMENAGAIFYYEKSVTGGGGLEDLLAHEIVHQWFGDMVTETDFKHLWLSEGFATYLTDVYIESKYGTDSMNRRLDEQRSVVNSFAEKSTLPVVDTSSNYMRLLNANSYQKGGWILHMLRNTVGDRAFKNIIREHYRKFAGKNSSSADFVATAEMVVKKNLKPFFNQWLYKPGTPILATTWKYNAAKRNVIIVVEQKQPSLFSFPLELELKTANGNILKTVTVQKRKTSIVLPVKGEVTEMMTDPNYKLLWKAYPVIN